MGQGGQSFFMIPVNAASLAKNIPATNFGEQSTSNTLLVKPF